jgi:hypothetical protein
MDKYEIVNQKYSFDDIQPEIDILGSGIPRFNKISRYTTFDEDLLELKKKWHCRREEVLVQHMIDSLIIFNHNRANINHYPTHYSPKDRLKLI